MNISWSTRKYSCSGPIVVTTRFADVSPNSLSTRIACTLTASMERSNGVLRSSASPVYEQNAVGMYSVPSLTKAGDVQSHAV